MVKRGKFFSIFAVLTLLILLAPAVILAPGGNVAATGEGVVQEVTATFTFNENATGDWWNFTAGSSGIDATYGLCLEQYTRDNVVRHTTLSGCQFRNYTTGSGNVAGGGLDGNLSLAWNTFNFNQKYPYDTTKSPRYHDYGTGAHFGFMVGRGHIDEGGGDNFTFVFVLDYDSNGDMSAAGGKGFMVSVEENGIFMGHKIIGDFDIAKTGASYNGTFHLRNYDPSEVYDLGLLDVTGGVLEEWTDPIHTPLALLNYLVDGPYITPLNQTTDFEEIAWGRDPIKTVTSGHLGIGGTMDLSRNTALYLELKPLEPPSGAVRIQGTTACNLYINDTYAVTGDDGSPYGKLYELLLLYIPDQQLPLGEFFYQEGYTFTPFGMPNASTQCYAGTENFALASIAIQSSLTNALMTSTDQVFGLYPHPKVTSVVPAVGAPGQTMNVTIKGKYFLRADDFAPNTGSVSFGNGITVNNYSFTNSSPIDNAITANITIAGNATIGARDVNVTSCFGYLNGNGTAPYKNGTLKDGFTVSTDGSTKAIDKAIIVKGNQTSMFAADTNLAYRELNQSRNLSADDIQYLDGNTSTPGFDAIANKTNLKNAITDWAKNNCKSGGKLTIYISSHGGDETVQIGPDTVTAAELKGWIDELKSAPGVNISELVIVIDACHSGSFIASLKAPNTTVIPSCAADQLSWGYPGGSLFSQPFWKGITDNCTTVKAFNDACNRVNEIMHPPLVQQNPQYDDNGDGIGHKCPLPNGGDGNRTKDLRIGENISANSRPVIEHKTPDGSVPVNTTVALEVTATDDVAVTRVYGYVWAPDFVIPEDGFLDLEKIEFTNAGGDLWQCSYTFNKTGDYYITVFAEDAELSSSYGDDIHISAGASLEGHVSYLSRGTNNSRWAEPFKVRAFEPGNLNNELWNRTATTNNTGVFTITGLSPGTYDIGIKNWTCLSELVTGVTLNSTTVVDFGTTREGDSNGNDAVTGMDFSLLSGVFNTAPAGNPNCDFNRDNAVTGMDFSLLNGNFNKVGPLQGY